MKKLGLKLIPLLIVGLICWKISPINNGFKQIIFIFSMMDLEAIKGYILSFGVWAPIVSFMLMVFQSVLAPLPAFLITFANASLFGWIYGALLSWTSAMAGATLCFFIGRIYGRDVVQKFINQSHLEKVDKFFEDYGDRAVLIGRLLPFISFDGVSYAAGLTNMSFLSFFWATGIGQLPATLVYSYVGGVLPNQLKIWMFSLLTIFSISILISIIRRYRSEKA